MPAGGRNCRQGDGGAIGVLAVGRFRIGGDRAFALRGDGQREGIDGKGGGDLGVALDGKRGLQRIFLVGGHVVGPADKVPAGGRNCRQGDFRTIVIRVILVGIWQCGDRAFAHRGDGQREGIDGEGDTYRLVVIHRDSGNIRVGCARRDVLGPDGMVSLVRRGCQRHDRAGGVVPADWCGASLDTPVAADPEGQHVRLGDGYRKLLQDRLVAAHHLQRERVRTSGRRRAIDLRRSVVLGDRRPVVGFLSRQQQSFGQVAACNGPNVRPVAASGGQRLLIRTIHIAAWQGRRGRDGQRRLIHLNGQGDLGGVRRFRVVGDSEDHLEPACLKGCSGDGASRGVKFQPLRTVKHRPRVVPRSARGRERSAVRRAHPAVREGRRRDCDRRIDMDRAEDIRGLRGICAVRHRHREGEGTRGRGRAGNQSVSGTECQSTGKVVASLEGIRVRLSAAGDGRHVGPVWIGSILHTVGKGLWRDRQRRIDVQRQVDVDNGLILVGRRDRERGCASRGWRASNFTRFRVEFKAVRQRGVLGKRPGMRSHAARGLERRGVGLAHDAIRNRAGRDGEWRREGQE